MPDTPFLQPGSIQHLDHILVFCPEEYERAVRRFWEALGVTLHERVETEDIDHARAGRRLDLCLGANTMLTYRLAGSLDDSSFAGHIALRVTPQGMLKLLLGHPALEREYGKRGLIKWGTHDFSVFLRDPVGIRIEFRCPSAPHDLDDLLD